MRTHLSKLRRLLRAFLYLTGTLPWLRLHKSVFTTLSEGPRSPPPPYTPFSVFARTQNDLHSLRTNYRPQAVPIDLPNDPVSRERREAALRDRGLLPPRQPRDLSASGADTDRRIDVPRKIDGLSSGPDNGCSDAIEIAQSWRIRNSKWLSDTLPKSSSPGNSTTGGSCSYTEYRHSFLLIFCVQMLPHGSLLTPFIFSRLHPIHFSHLQQARAARRHHSRCVIHRIRRTVRRPPTTENILICPSRPRSRTAKAPFAKKPPWSGLSRFPMTTISTRSTVLRAPPFSPQSVMAVWPPHGDRLMLFLAG